MPQSEVSIANTALTLLGESRIASLDDDLKQAREIKAVFETVRDALLASHNWSFAMARVKLSPLAAAPAFGFNTQFLMPADCLRVCLVGEIFLGIDLSDYNNYPSEDVAFEGRNILTDLENPLRVRYVKRITDPTQFHPNFIKAFAAMLARDTCEAITQSGQKRDRAEGQLKYELNESIRVNAIMIPPRKLADGEWLDSRL